MPGVAVERMQPTLCRDMRGPALFLTKGLRTSLSGTGGVWLTLARGTGGVRLILVSRGLKSALNRGISGARLPKLLDKAIGLKRRDGIWCRRSNGDVSGEGLRRLSTTLCIWRPFPLTSSVPTLQVRHFTLCHLRLKQACRRLGPC